MPPSLPIQSLYDSCLVSVFGSICNAVAESSENVEQLRKIVQSNLHSGIREHLLQIATVYCKDDVYTLLDLLRVLLDRTTRKLDHSRGDEDSWMPVEHCASLYTHLDQCNATGIQELTVKVRLYPRMWGELQAVSAANTVFHRVLRNGLASSLHTLVLCSVCDNETLRLLGLHCHSLRHLDMTSSWLVDDGGLRQLCFKDELHAPPGDFYSDHTENTIRYYLSVRPDALNRCCETLQQVRIQDTNTSEVGVAMLLLFIPNLKSLGGFIYYRNVGDAIMNLQKLKPSLRLNLTDLWDTCLPPEKACQLAEAIPDIASLYTRGNCLSSMVFFPALSSLTVDFDFCNFKHPLEELLMRGGALLKKLVVVDQNHPIDIAILAKLCPQLEELGAKLKGSCSSNELKNLISCRIRVATTDPVTSLLIHARNLAHMEVSLEEECEFFCDTVMSQVLSENPSPQQLRTFLLTSQCFFTVHTVKLLMATCPNLRLLGDLLLWSGVCERDMQELECEILKRRLDITLRYRGNWPNEKKRIAQMLRQ